MGQDVTTFIMIEAKIITRTFGSHSDTAKLIFYTFRRLLIFMLVTVLRVYGSCVLADFSTRQNPTENIRCNVIISCENIKFRCDS